MRRPLVTPPLVISVLSVLCPGRIRLRVAGRLAEAGAEVRGRLGPGDRLGHRRCQPRHREPADHVVAPGILFGYRWTCNGGTVEVRKAVESGGGFDIRFPGNPGRYPVATAVYPTALGISLAPNPDGSFHVTEGGNSSGDSFPPRSDGTFVIVLF
jgi:hypothetical protein